VSELVIRFWMMGKKSASVKNAAKSWMHRSENGKIKNILRESSCARLDSGLSV
jgi:hypothetical protein